MKNKFAGPSSQPSLLQAYQWHTKENLKDGVCLPLSAAPTFAYIHTSESFKVTTFFPLGQWD